MINSKKKGYYSAVQQKHNMLIINPFWRHFCSRKTKMPPKLSSFPTFDPELKSRMAGGQLIISILNLLSSNL